MKGAYSNYLSAILHPRNQNHRQCWLYRSWIGTIRAEMISDINEIQRKDVTVRVSILLALTCVGLLLGKTSSAAVVGLYEAQVSVPDQSEEARDSAIGEAFKLVVTKISGSDAALSDADVMAASEKAISYVKTMRYENDPEQGLMLSVKFADKSMQTLLQASGESVWGETRPDTLLWLAIDSGAGRDRVSESSQWARAMSSAMAQRGLPALFPLWDLDDEVALPSASLWGLFDSDIRSASARYNSAAYVGGRIIKLSSGRWSFQGYVMYNGQRNDIKSSGADAAEVSRSVADTIASSLTSSYAIVPSGNVTGRAGSQTIRVNQIKNFQQYRVMLDYLKAKNGIRDVELLAIQGDQAILALALVGSWDQLWNELSLDGRLRRTLEQGEYLWQP